MTFEAATPEVLLEKLQVGTAGPHVVAIGGGHGLSRTLRAALYYAGRADAVVSVADDGGSSGRLVPDLDIPPPGDIRKCLLALTQVESIWKEIFEYRFEEADVAGHSSVTSFSRHSLRLREVSSQHWYAELLLKASGSVIPACQQPLMLVAETEVGLLKGQVTIQQHRGRIDEIWVQPQVLRPHPEQSWPSRPLTRSSSVPGA